MKNIALLSIGLLFSAVSIKAQYAQDAENTQGNRSVLTNVCWTMYGWDVSGTTPISGLYSFRTGQQNNPLSPANMFTPFLAFTGSGSIDFKHKLNSANGDFRELSVYLVDNGGTRVQTLLTHTYRNGNTNVNGDPTVVISEALPVNFSGVYKVEWEVSGNGGNSRGMLDDISISASYATDPTDCSALVQCPDGDGDGVCDADDDFPTDPKKAYASAQGLVSWAFEDLWPYKGDYDFNDMVAKVNPVYVTNANNQYVAIHMTTTIEAVGAGLHNGLGLRFIIPGSTITSSQVNVTGSVLNGHYAVMAANGTEAGHGNQIVVIVAEDVNDVIKRQGARYFRTEAGEPAGTTTPVDIVVDFNNPLSAVNILYEYFVIKDQTRGNEIHIPGVGATALVDPLLFATGGTDVNPAPSIFYLTKDNLPWGMHVAGDFSWPLEKTDINLAYSKFAAWAQSGGISNQDWYTNPAERDASKIY